MICFVGSIAVLYIARIATEDCVGSLCVFQASRIGSEDCLGRFSGRLDGYWILCWKYCSVSGCKDGFWRLWWKICSVLAVLGIVDSYMTYKRQQISWHVRIVALIQQKILVGWGVETSASCTNTRRAAPIQAPTQTSWLENPKTNQRMGWFVENRPIELRFKLFLWHFLLFPLWFKQ